MNRTILAAGVAFIGFGALTACHPAAETECDRHNLTQAEHDNCVAHLKANESQLQADPHQPPQ